MKNLKNKIVRLRLPHYIFAGVLTLMVEYGSFLLFFYGFSLSAVRANTMSFIFSLSTNFLLNKLWVFKTDAAQRVWQKQIVLYIGLALLNLGITNLGLYYLSRFVIPAFILKLCFVGLVASWNFVIYKRFVFMRNQTMIKV